MAAGASTAAYTMQQRLIDRGHGKSDDAQEKHPLTSSRIYRSIFINDAVDAAFGDLWRNCLRVAVLLALSATKLAYFGSRSCRFESSLIHRRVSGARLRDFFSTIVYPGPLSKMICATRQPLPATI
jgi:hypothetical protein